MIEGYASGEFAAVPFGGGGLVIEPVVTVATPSTTSGPNVTFSWSAVFLETLSQQSVRVQVLRSDHTMLANGTFAFWDSGWVTTTSTSMTVSVGQVGIPTDTGSASIDPTLSLVVRVMVSPDVNALAGGRWGTAESAAFDIQWGHCSLAWVEPPSPLVGSTPEAFSWTLTSTRAVAQGTYQVQLTTTDGLVVFFDSGVLTGTASAFTLPYALAPDTSYMLVLNAANANGVGAAPLLAIIIGAPADTGPTPTGGPLERFCQLVGFRLDLLRSQAEALSSVSDPMRIPGSLLPALAYQFGVTYEAALGMAQTRRLLRGIVHSYKTKGTIPGIEGIATALTDWGAVVTRGKNLLLDVSQVPNLATPITHLHAETPTTAAGVPVHPTDYTGTAFPSSWPTLPAAITAPPALAFYAAATYSPASALALTTTWVDSGWRVPTEGATAMSGSVWIWANGFGSSGTWTLQLRYYSGVGAVLATATGSSGVTVSAATWTQLTITNSSPPTGAVWVEMLVTSSSYSFSTVNSVLVVAAPQISATSTQQPYEMPRTLTIALTPDRINLVQNPSFESSYVATGVSHPDTTGWAATSATLTATNTTAYAPPATPTPGLWAGQITGIGSSGAVVMSSKMPVAQPLSYTGSVYVSSAATLRSVSLSLLCYDVSGSFLSSITGTPLTEVSSEWIRLVVSSDPGSGLPSGCTQVALQVSWTGTIGSSEVHYFDCALFEEGWTPQPYFDGNLYDGSVFSNDYTYATPGAGGPSAPYGPSYYYHQKGVKVSRLASVLAGVPADGYGEENPLLLTGFLPVGTQYLLSTH